MAETIDNQTPVRPRHNNWASMFLGLSITLLVITSSIVVLVFFALGQYAYPSADDFCMASGVRDHGLFDHLWQHYFEWSGRYTGNALYAIYPRVFGLFESYAWMPMLLILLLFAATTFLLSRIFSMKTSAAPILVTAFVFTCIYLLGLRHTASSLYWMAGAMTYQSANILLLFGVGLIVQIKDRQKNHKSYLTLTSILLLLVAAGVGTNEINMIVLTSLVALSFLVTLKEDPSKRGSWLVLLVITAACVAIVYFSPGNTVREATFELRHDWPRSLDGSLRMGWWTLVVWTGTPLFMVATLLVPMAAAWLQRSSSRTLKISNLTLMILVVFTFGMPFVLQFPAWWAMGGWPPPRTVDAIFFVFLCGWFFLLGAITIRFRVAGLMFDEQTQLRPKATAVLLLLSLLFCAAILINGKFQRAWQDLWYRAPAFNEYMQQRHERIEQAINSGQYYLEVPAYKQEVPKSIYFNDIRPDGRDWRNRCYANYFGLQGIQREKQRSIKRNSRLSPRE